LEIIVGLPYSFDGMLGSDITFGLKFGVAALTRP
jgi:hypothetical protein